MRSVRGAGGGDGHIGVMQRMAVVAAVGWHGLFAADVTAVVMVGMVVTVMGVVVLDWDVITEAAAVVRFGRVVPHGLLPPRHGPARVLQRLEAFLHALQKRQGGPPVSP